MVGKKILVGVTLVNCVQKQITYDFLLNVVLLELINRYCHNIIVDNEKKDSVVVLRELLQIFLEI